MMLHSEEIRLKLSSAARQRIEEAVRGTTEPKLHIAGLLLAGPRDSEMGRWSIGLYSREVVESPNFQGALLDCEGLELVVPQAHVLPKLRHATLHWENFMFIVRQSS